MARPQGPEAREPRLPRGRLILRGIRRDPSPSRGQALVRGGRQRLGPRLGHPGRAPVAPGRLLIPRAVSLSGSAAGDEANERVALLYIFIKFFNCDVLPHVIAEELIENYVPLLRGLEPLLGYIIVEGFSSFHFPYGHRSHILAPREIDLHFQIVN